MCSKKLNIFLLVLVIVLAGALAYVTLLKKPGATEAPQAQTNTPAENLPATCVSEEDGDPVITSLSAYSGPVGTKLEIKGCNFSGFEGDLTAWIENSDGISGILYGENGSDDSKLVFTLKPALCQEDTSYSGLPCEEYLDLVPGIYKIYAEPWGARSNEATFIIK
jgi:hypothetical protein